MVSSLTTYALAACVLLLVQQPADAADLAARPSQIGVIFAEPPQPAGPVIVYQQQMPAFIGTALRVPGYYGRPRDFEYRNYYGTSPLAIYERLPYACGFVASC